MKPTQEQIDAAKIDVVERIRSNIEQALSSLTFDELYVDASREFGHEIVGGGFESGVTFDDIAAEHGRDVARILFIAADKNGR